MTNQEVFDKVAAHLRKQGRPSARNGEGLYRGPKGLMCAIGVLIPDELYSVKFEKISVNALPDDVRAVFGDADPDLLSYLQNVHDSLVIDRVPRSKFLATLEEELREVAEGRSDIVYTPPVA